MAETARKTTHKDHKPVAPKAPVLVSPPAVSPPGGGTAPDQSNLKWYQKKIMGVPMWVFLGIAGAIGAYFLYEYMAGQSSTAAAATPASAATDPTGGTAGGDTSGGSSGGGSGVVDPISGNTGVGNAGPTVTQAPAPASAPAPTPTPIPASVPAARGPNLPVTDNRPAAKHVHASSTNLGMFSDRTPTKAIPTPKSYVGMFADQHPTTKSKPAPAKLPTEKAMVKVSKIKTAPKASAKKEPAGKAATISHAMTPR